ncbi:hypothetical protein BST39_20995 [Mycobacterium paraseoulense]|uniref:Uncharacterized protein n=1 Tax=Mycobacterium paraseoulense TaxID=590652 RepID=A0A1X0I7F2_9MYCO|nr:hypothetical protein BST39_20995 [Mycobacterium paraseoulense]
MSGQVLGSQFESVVGTAVLAWANGPLLRFFHTAFVYLPFSLPGLMTLAAMLEGVRAQGKQVANAVG